MAALMAAGTFGVHQLRFAMSDDHARAVYGHGYLSAVAPALAVLLLFAVAAGVNRVVRGASEVAPRLLRVWGGASGGLLVAYCAQESLEGVLTHGHATGMFEHGGWVALPLALAVGLGIALVSRGAAAASIVTHRPAPAASAGAPLVDALLPPWRPRRTHAAARHLAARGPPVGPAAL
jgi:hypothetical protein